jgi:hypothetical protein
MQIEKQERAARRAFSEMVARLHHLPAPELVALARAVLAEVDERETTAARMVAAEKMEAR